MGFQRKTYKLIWPEGDELHGLEVRAQGLSVGELEVVAGLRAQVGTDIDKIKPLVEIFAGALLSWNYESADGTPIGITAEDILRDADMRDVLPVIMAWVGEVGAIPAPLEKASPSGAPSQEVSMPMETLSSSLPS